MSLPVITERPTDYLEFRQWISDLVGELEKHHVKSSRGIFGLMCRGLEEVFPHESLRRAFLYHTAKVWSRKDLPDAWVVAFYLWLDPRSFGGQMLVDDTCYALAKSFATWRQNSIEQINQYRLFDYSQV